ncbi:binding--dependent transport system inner membrane component family protein [Burkholderia thailandensis MSMB121]|uniref:ABC transporter permease n=2 Tax=Burkholderia humptydooensis TaxID=430531 RepID=A0A7U4PCA2_9BURK|nr:MULTISPECIES: ABC transporter permease [Burkholderia]AGK50245.1 binding--dependent transport system inner membrane component family protein [Burkholderia thailandensis MSMB121]ATF32205.1 polyamine ABC transporter substrate-binding protein [Burkholderia thailandensis]AJY40602.1 binding--dependent transport system inner membrane component family protein [Burkholderia sp. 2002721687]ALX46929.1 polyamine ABC transporter substrate-binding protein [Burkholderia humptydooensis]EIP85615.1 ABC trans
MTIATQSAPPTPSLKRELKAAEARKRAMALLLVAPLAIFLLLVFVVPIGALLTRAVQNPEIAAALPRTVAALSNWDRKAPPADAAYAALAADLTQVADGEAMGALARRLNTEIPGYRSLVAKTARAMPLTGDANAPLAPAQTRAKLLELDARWGDPAYWQAIAKNSGRYSPFYLLAALDHKQDGFGSIVPADPDQSIYLAVFGRTLLIGFAVTLFALALGYPLAYWISTLPERRANLAMILVLIPFWTSVLVRVAAWIVLLQSEGLVNRALIDVGLISQPLALLFNRVGVYISMTHILLPFMILPLYSVMKSIPPSYQRAAVSLGSHPFAAFWRVYVPQTYPGVGAGALLVFILAIGYYITPALLGGPNDQMVSYYVAYFTNVTINWGMACALGGLLLAATLVLYAIYGRFTRSQPSLG